MRAILLRARNEKIGNKFWTSVYFNNGTIWVPALWEQAFIAQQVVVCERIKYPNLSWDAASMPIEFITKAMNGQNIEGLCHQYGLIKQGSFSRISQVIKESKIFNEANHVKRPDVSPLLR